MPPHIYSLTLLCINVLGFHIRPTLFCYLFPVHRVSYYTISEIISSMGKKMVREQDAYNSILVERQGAFLAYVGVGNWDHQKIVNDFQ